MMNEYYLYNNVALTSMVIYHVVQQDEKDIARVAVLLPILLDDFSTKILSNGDEPTLIQLSSMYQRNMANYDNRFENIIPLMLDSLSLLIEIGAITLQGKNVIIADNGEFSNVIQRCPSKRLKLICEVADKMIIINKKVTNKSLYTKLRIKL